MSPKEMDEAMGREAERLRAERDALRADLERLGVQLGAIRRISSQRAFKAAEALLAGHDAGAKWLAEERARVRAAAYRSVALELRASIVCSKRDGDALDETWAEAAAETIEGYADGDGEPDDERNRSLAAAPGGET